MTEQLTLLCVHAHPDDESSSTGGVLRAYANEGVRTVLVDVHRRRARRPPDGTTPDADTHDPAAVASTAPRSARRPRRSSGSRRSSCSVPGTQGWRAGRRTTRRPRSGRRPSPTRRHGSMSDPPRRAPPGRRHLRRQRLYRPSRPHPGAPHHPGPRSSSPGCAASDPAFPISVFKRFREVMAEAGVEPPPVDEDVKAAVRPAPRRPDRRRHGRLGVVEAKFAALSAHAGARPTAPSSSRWGLERFSQLFGTEWFVRAVDPLGRRVRRPRPVRRLARRPTGRRRGPRGAARGSGAWLPVSGRCRACTGPRPGRRGMPPGRGVSVVSRTPSASRCSAGDLLVELLGQHVDPGRVLRGLGVQLDLRQHLVGERVATSRSSGGPWRCRG